MRSTLATADRGPAETRVGYAIGKGSDYGCDKVLAALYEKTTRPSLGSGFSVEEEDFAYS